VKDNFSIQASAYATFRPHYLDEMIAYIISFVKDKGVALDLATGNAQVAFKLAQYFTTIHATDISEKQLENATVASYIFYQQGKAEHTNFIDAHSILSPSIKRFIGFNLMPFMMKFAGF
jgi:tRNA/tmRNA/rRNA uracil-C5-methylase (TrmA/RlmC/RlmD family)